MELEFSGQNLEKYSNTKFHENMFNGSRVVPCGQTDWRTDRYFNGTWIFLADFGKNIQIPNLMKICLMGAELFYADRRTDGRTDLTNVTVASRNFSTRLKKLLDCQMYKEKSPSHWDGPRNVTFGLYWILIILNNYDYLNWIVSIPSCTSNKFINWTVFIQHTNNSCKSTTG